MCSLGGLFSEEAHDHEPAIRVGSEVLAHFTDIFSTDGRHPALLDYVYVVPSILILIHEQNLLYIWTNHYIHISVRNGPQLFFCVFQLFKLLI